MKHLNYHQVIVWVFFSLLFSCNAPKSTESSSPMGWREVTTPTEASLRGLSPLTADIAWATGSNGRWMLTMDGGEHWDEGVIAGLDTVDFRDIEAFDAKTAVAISAGQPAVIYKTTDGGKSWEKKYEGPEEAFLDGLAFVNERRGYAYGDPVDGKWMVLLTLNGGDTWEALNRTAKVPEGEAGFAASGSGILAKGHEIWMASGGVKSNIYYSDNGGVDWDTIPAPLIQGEPSQGIFSLTFMNKRHIVAVGGDYLDADNTSGNSAFSFDRGQTWQPTKGTPPSGYRSGVSYFPEKGWLIAVGPNGSDFSKDGGSNWANFSSTGFHAVKCSKNGEAIWASGADGRVAKLDY
ncbi:photosystem II stability/assembly factor-like protein [Echinicola strongylocentroti]|uniref:Photosystem II stability/assembly factor-like protein n=1 Tax=Echinicola strongylocentroti TaxID=1795355 RepID=A0A2Z4II26_9BACT|nr:YCF48-related protein [Echinicola strongylocentroti]AWW30614.1 photosystem II stability/assembly factor-like protein [Echinicola strongylocentroti]